MHGSLINLKQFYSLLLVCLLLTGCIAPLAIGGSSVTAAIASTDKGIKGTFNDANLSAKVKMRLYEFAPDMHAKISVNVQNSEVFLTGLVIDANWKSEAEKLAREIEGVTNVINNIEISEEESIGSVTSDAWITTRIKSKLLFVPDTYSLNYVIKTVGGVVYIIGTAHDQEEINRVLEVAANVGGVKKVINHLKILARSDSEDDTNTEDNKSSAITSTELSPLPQNTQD